MRTTGDPKPFCGAGGSLSASQVFNAAIIGQSSAGDGSILTLLTPRLLTRRGAGAPQTPSLVGSRTSATSVTLLSSRFNCVRAFAISVSVHGGAGCADGGTGAGGASGFTGWAAPSAGEGSGLAAPFERGRTAFLSSA